MDSEAEVRSLGLSAGFDLVGFARAEALDPAPLRRWLDAGHHASMGWLESSAEVRCDPRLLLPGARSVIALAVNYYRPGSTELPGGGRISRYAWGRDYHKVVGGKLRALRRGLMAGFPGIQLWGGVDAVPIAEKVWAERAGLGWIAKNGNLITRAFGSWVFLATLITDLELSPDAPHPERCGSCELCLPACPTAAIVSPGVIDSRRCLSFHTIEHRDPWPDWLAADPKDWLFGCDACQDVCPWSKKFAVESTVDDFAPRATLMERSLESFGALDEASYESITEGTALRRAGREGLRRTIRTLGAIPPNSA